MALIASKKEQPQHTLKLLKKNKLTLFKPQKLDHSPNEDTKHNKHQVII